ncbi:MAG: response regulator [Chitinophagaceae bacterium]
MAKFNNVLLVEDDPITVLVCERIIKMTGFSEVVNTMDNGKDAIEFIKEKIASDHKNLPDVIFLDINMPIMNGWEFLQHFDTIKEQLPKLPQIFILSSTVDPEDFKRAASYPTVKNFISKPLIKEHLDEIND